MLFKASNRSEDYWISVSDLMAGLMILFLFIAISYMVKTQKENEMFIYIEQEYELAQNAIYKALFEEFKDDLEKWDAKIDKENLAFIFLSPDVLFKSGESTLQERYKIILDDFFPRYIVSLDNVFYKIDYPNPDNSSEMVTHNKKAKDNISAIRIEGHANKLAPSEYNGVQIRTNNEKFLYNMQLSSDRSQSVLTYILKLDLNDQKPWVRDNVRSVGYSSSRPVFLTNGKDDLERSKRVEFRIVLDAQEKLFELIQKKKQQKLNEINYIGKNDFVGSQVLDQYREELKDAKEELKTTQRLLSELDIKLDRAQKELATIEQKINNLKSENRNLEKERDNINRTISILKKERERIVGENKRIKNEEEQMEQNINRLEMDENSLGRKIENKKEELNDLNLLIEAREEENTTKQKEAQNFGNSNAEIQNNAIFTKFQKNPEPLRPVKPRYPFIAQQAGIQGRVVIKAFVDKNGLVTKTQILESVDPTLDEAAREAVKRTRFSPAQQGTGNSVGAWITIPVDFKL